VNVWRIAFNANHLHAPANLQTVVFWWDSARLGYASRGDLFLAFDPKVLSMAERHLMWSDGWTQFHTIIDAVRAA
jgi:hypothetical protein